MKKVKFATWRRVAVVCLVTLIGTGWALAAHAGPSQKAEGLWTYFPTEVIPQIFETCEGSSDPAPIILALTEMGEWSGTFNGLSNESGKLVIHCSGWFSFYGIVTFEDVEVDGKNGALIMRVEGSKPDPTADWCGSWSILDGTRDLANLSGYGGWWGPGYAPGDVEWGKIYYDGNIKWTRKPLHVRNFEKCQNDLCDFDDD
jgi:hypothetical protein